jgi:plasmid stabilization system protein ParE
MTRLTLAPLAEGDLSAILTFLRSEAGGSTAERYRSRFRETFDRLRTFPESGAPRPDFGADLRIAVVHPYVVFYDFVPSGDALIVWRILHGKVSVDEKLLRDR